MRSFATSGMLLSKWWLRKYLSNLLYYLLAGFLMVFSVLVMLGGYLCSAAEERTNLKSAHSLRTNILDKSHLFALSSVPSNETVNRINAHGSLHITGVNMFRQQQLSLRSNVGGVNATAAHSTMLLTTISNQAIAASLARILELTMSAISIDSERLVAQVDSDPSTTVVEVDFTVIAQASDYIDTTFTGDISAALHSKIVSTLNASISSGTMVTMLRAVSSAIDAPELATVTHVTLTPLTYSVFSTELTSGGYQNDRSYGQFTGFAMDIIVVMLFLVVGLTVLVAVRSYHRHYLSNPQKALI